jgi:acyl-CoA hydrolase
MRVVDDERLIRMLGAVPGTPRVVASGSCAAPLHALSLVDKALAEFTLFMVNAPAGIPDRDGITYEAAFVGPGMRGNPRLRYYPCRLSLVPHLLRHALPPDVVVLHTSPPEGGAVSLGVDVSVLPAAIEATRARGGLVVAQANRRMPVTRGDAEVPVEHLDYLVEVDQPLPAHVAPEPDAVSAGVGERVAALVPQGACLQAGIGGIPDAALRALRDRRGLHVWTEMFSDGVLALERAGCLDPDEPITASFCFGSPDLYDWMDGNPRLRMLRTEKTNDPGAIESRPRLVSINSALQVDLFAQANAARVGRRVYSGFGGQTDFIVGAMHSVGGLAVIALPSWHPRADVSTVVPVLTGPVTSFQHSWIVTEQGAAAVWGHDADDQARHIIDHAAHPLAREGLRAQAGRLGLAVG